MRNQKQQVLKGSQCSGVSQTSIQACKLLMIRDRIRRAWRSKAGLVIMTMPICDASMQKKKKKKKKKGKGKKYEDKINSKVNILPCHR
jgi:hypothetical protein